MAWTLAPALVALRAEVDRRWPGRSKRYDGTIGDAAHQARTSEHNPDSLGVVRAIDVDIDGIVVQQLLDATIGDDRVHYVIYNRRIYSRTNGWAARPYSGANAHTKHVHISLRNRTSENASAAVVARAAGDTSPWLSTATTTPKPKPPASGAPGSLSVAALKAARYSDPPKAGQPVGPSGAQVRVFEAALVATGWLASRDADGHYGSNTVKAVQGFQRKHSGAKNPDGWMGAKELARLKQLAKASWSVTK